MKYKIKNNRLYNENNEVAVAVSHDFGGGWSSEIEIDPTDAKFNILFLENNIQKIYEILEETDTYSGGVADVKIEWIPKKTISRINNYDGAETIEILKKNNNYFIA